MNIDILLSLSDNELEQAVNGLSKLQQLDVTLMVEEHRKTNGTASLDDIVDTLSGCTATAIRNRRKHWIKNVIPMCETLNEQLRAGE